MFGILKNALLLKTIHIRTKIILWPNMEKKVRTLGTLR